jgi:pyridoxal phosphate enzyme (YggS family)
MSVTGKNLQDVRRRIETAVEAAQRAAGSVRLIAVSKSFPASAVVEAIEEEQSAFGENYVQEAVDKMAGVDAILGGGDAGRPEWHFIGPIQSNKTRAIAEHFDWVHSVDRLKVAERLSAQRDASRPPLNVLIEVNVDGEASKSGVAPAEVEPLARAIVGLPNLRLRGLMTVPAPRDDEAGQRAAFARLRRLGDDLRAGGLPCDELSMGMSSDFEAAIAEGATMVRIGSAIFGARVVRALAVPA